MNHSAMKYLGIDNLDNTKTALLMIDMQKAFVEPGAALCIQGAKATVPACEAGRRGDRVTEMSRKMQ